jgi:carbon monoxide dehydrogenase subunit G
MGIEIKVEIKRVRKIETPADEAFARIDSVENMASHFPKLSRIDKVEGQTYSWVLDKIGNEAYKHRVHYTSTWQWHADDRKITWHPVKGQGNTEIAGMCHIKDSGNASEVHFTTEALLRLPLPIWTKAIAKPIVKNQFEALIDHYIDNVIRAMA